MALTELQKVDPDNFKRVINNRAGEISRILSDWTNFSKFMANMGAQDLIDAGVTTSEAGTALANLRSFIGWIVDLYEGNPVDPGSIVPRDVIDKLRRFN